jgi:predicted GNAT family acetyltransferase
VDPFDLAWDFLKAPLDESSIVYSRGDPDDPFAQPTMYADFDDTDEGVMYGRGGGMATGKTLRMEATRGPYGDVMNVRVRKPETPEDVYNEDVGGAVFSRNRGSRQFSADDARVEPEFRGRGVGSDMYSLAALLAAQEGNEIVGSEHQSEDARRLWGDKETWPPAADWGMTVRNSEPMEHAFSTLRKIK